MTIVQLSNSDLKGLNADELVQRFADIGAAQDEAELDGKISRFNQLYQMHEAVENELRRRPGDGRRALIALFQHRSGRARYNAAVALLAIEPVTARQMLERIRDWKIPPCAADASGMLRSLDEGRYVPS